MSSNEDKEGSMTYLGMALELIVPHKTSCTERFGHLFVSREDKDYCYFTSRLNSRKEKYGWRFNKHTKQLEIASMGGSPQPVILWVPCQRYSLIWHQSTDAKLMDEENKLQKWYSSLLLHQVKIPISTYSSMEQRVKLLKDYKAKLS